MTLLWFLVIAIIVYVASFKSNFNAEQVQKVVPVLVGVTVICLLFGILASL